MANGKDAESGEKKGDVQPSYRDRLRGELLAIGTRVMAADGLDGMQARRIAREAGCSVGSIYNVFGDMDGFIVEVNTLTMQRMRTHLEAALDAVAGSGMHAGLSALAHAYARFALEHPGAWEAVFKHRRPVTAQAVPQHRNEQDALLGLIAGLLSGIEGDPLARASMSRALFGAVHGIVTLAVDDRLEGQVRNEIEAQVTFLVDVLVRGLPR